MNYGLFCSSSWCPGYSTGQYGLHSLPSLSTRTPGQSLHFGRFGQLKSIHLGVHFLGHTEQFGLHGSGLFWFVASGSNAACSFTRIVLFLSALIRLTRIKLITANSITIIKITNIISIVSMAYTSLVSYYMLFRVPFSVTIALVKILSESPFSDRYHLFVKNRKETAPDTAI